MYIVVQHQVTDPGRFWPADVARYATMTPPHFTLHQTFAATDGSRGVCVWEAASLEELRAWLDGFTGDASVNTYFAAVNREGRAVPDLTPRAHSATAPANSPAR